MESTPNNPIATIEMEDGGVIRCELYPDKAPETVRNFIALARGKKLYDKREDAAKKDARRQIDRAMKGR